MTTIVDLQLMKVSGGPVNTLKIKPIEILNMEFYDLNTVYLRLNYYLNYIVKVYSLDVLEPYERIYFVTRLIDVIEAIESFHRLSFISIQNY